MKNIQIRKWFFCALCFVFLQSAGFGEAEYEKQFGFLLQLAGLQKKGDYKIEVDIKAYPPNYEELIKKSPQLTREFLFSEYRIYLHNNLLFMQVNPYPKERPITVNVFYDGGPFMYEFMMGNDCIYFSKNKKDPFLSVPTFNFSPLLMSVDQEHDLKSSTNKVQSIKSRLKNGLAIKENYTYLIPEKNGFLFKLRFHKTKSSIYLIDYVFESHSKHGKYITKIQYKIKPLKKPIPLEIFTPNGFGDKILTSQDNIEIFVRDFLPTPMEMKKLLVSKEARAEYEAEAKNRPRVGLIDKYLKKIKLESE